MTVRPGVPRMGLVVATSNDGLAFGGAYEGDRTEASTATSFSALEEQIDQAREG